MQLYDNQIFKQKGWKLFVDVKELNQNGTECSCFPSFVYTYYGVCTVSLYNVYTIT